MSDADTLPDEIKDIKIVVVGDGAVGKTCLLHVYANNVFPMGYTPTVFDNFTKQLTINGQQVALTLLDTAGQEDYARLRTMGYDNTDCFVACFAVNDAITFENIKYVWLKELQDHCPGTPILLAGTKADQRGVEHEEKAGNRALKEVPVRKILRLVKDEKLSGYVETSAMSGGDDVDQVFTEAARIVLGCPTSEVEEGGKKRSVFCDFVDSFRSCTTLQGED